MDGKCLTCSLVYQATVTSANDDCNTYAGITERTFKTRYTNHKTTFKYDSKRSIIELSKYIWSLKDKHINFKASWKTLRRAPAYNNNTNKCNLCLWEKYYILYRPDLSSLNKRNKLLNTCRHSSKFLLMNGITYQCNLFLSNLYY